MTIDNDMIEQISAFELLHRNIAWQEKEKRLELYKRPEIAKKLLEYLNESVVDRWKYFKELATRIDIDEIFTIFPINVLIDYLNNDQNYAYVFFCCIFEKDIKLSLEFILKNDNLFIELMKSMDHIYDRMGAITANEALEIIVKQNELNTINKNYSFIRCMSEEEQYKLISLDFSPEMLAKIVQNMSWNLKQDFFLNDRRAVNIYKYFNIVSLVDPTSFGSTNGIKLNKEILNDKDFFNKIKTTDIDLMRQNINVIQQTNPSIKLREELKKYYDEIIAGYDKETEMLEIHKPQFTAYSDFAKAYTSDTISKIVADALFEDNLNNVKINIKEILRYHEQLDQKLIDDDMIALYKIILEIDTLSNQQKIQIYRKFKDKELNTTFYMHLRMLKDMSYNDIKSSLFNTKLRRDSLSQDKTQKYGVEIFDLTDKKYIMLVRCIEGSFRTSTHRKKDCYTLISNENNEVYNNIDAYIYGYNDFDIQKVIHVNESDSYSSNDYQVFQNTSISVNRIMKPEEIVNNYSNSTIYSEIQITNKKLENGYESLKPSYIVCYDEVTPDALEESQRLNIPICIIKKKIIDITQLNQIESEKYII